MAKIYSPPKEVPVPELRLPVGCDVNAEIKKHQEAEKQFVEKLRDFLKRNNPNDKLAGETVRFGVADGYARYMVAASKPLALVHMPLGDAWHYQHIERLTLKDIKSEIERAKALDKLFGGK